MIECVTELPEGGFKQPGGVEPVTIDNSMGTLFGERIDELADDRGLA